ncbi:LPXTG cell wall anchor domain-containing protein [Nocardioides albidus]|nr:LPXTG cell wall anchor domain-containing protein [Nocardioides albidus]
MRRYLVMGSAVTASLAFLLALAGWGSPASAEPYTPALPTSCRVSVPTKVVGARVVVRVQVSVAGSVQPRGTVTVGVDDHFSKKVRYDGVAVEVRGPRLAAGEHRARAVFVPDDPARFSGCRDSVRFSVGAVRGSGQAGAGGLPNTGGPHLGFLLAGVGLVATGGGLVGRGRRAAS